LGDNVISVGILWDAGRFFCYPRSRVASVRL